MPSLVAESLTVDRPKTTTGCGLNRSTQQLGGIVQLRRMEFSLAFPMNSLGALSHAVWPQSVDMMGLQPLRSGRYAGAQRSPSLKVQ